LAGIGNGRFAQQTFSLASAGAAIHSGIDQLFQAAQQ
jgi:hypothetical protein